MEPEEQKSRKRNQGGVGGGNDVVMNMGKEKEEGRHKKKGPGIPGGAEQRKGDKQLPAGSLAGQGPQEF